MSTSRRTSEPKTKLVPLDSVVPYWRNPRRIPDDAVNALRESIERYGYTQPIVVDGENTIIIGHTRYAALRRMGAEKVQVRVVTGLPASKVKQLRVLDNRSAELTSWNMDELSDELEELDKDLMRSFFPEIGGLSDDGPEVGSDEGPDTSDWDEVVTEAEFVCPSCFHSWKMEVDKEAVMAGKLEVTDNG